jgi:hypothetical protein
MLSFKKRIASVAVGAMLIAGLTGTSGAAAATPKAGAACSKAGITAVIKTTKQQTKFTCVKSGKKLAWNKGVVTKVVAKPAPSKPIPPKPISLDNLDINQVRAAAYKEFTRELAENSAFLPEIEYMVGPSVSQSRVEAEKKGLNQAAAFWSDIYKPTTVYIGYLTEADVEWVDKAFCDGAGFCPTGEGFSSPPVSQQIKLEPSGNCNFAAATRGSKGQFFYQCLGRGSGDLKNKQTGAHEYTHFAQSYVHSFNAPNWWIEGSADYFGGAIGVIDGTALPKDLDAMVANSSYNYVRQDLIKIDPTSANSVYDGFMFTYQNVRTEPGARYVLAHVSYYPGALATEAMIALWGMDKVKQFMVNLKGKAFDTTFEESFGVSTETFYRAVSKYVVAMYEDGR